MANAFGTQTRDPKAGGGRFMKREVREALNARHAAETYGQSTDQKSLASMGMLLERESRPIQQYVGPIMQALQQAQEDPSVTTFRNILPLVQEAQTLVGQDATLEDNERKRALKVLADLTAHIRKQLTFKARTQNTLKGVVRKRGEAATDWMANSGSAVLGLAGKALQRRQAKQQAAQEQGQDSANMRAKLLGTYAQRSVAGTSATGGEFDDFGPTGPSPTRKRPTGGGESTGEGGAGTLGKILTVDRGIHKEVKDINKNLVDTREQDANQFESTEKAGERAEEDKGLGGLTSKVEKVGGGKKAGGLLEKAGGLFGEGGALGKLGGIAKMAGPALTLLGQGALIVGAAFAGWKIGEMIDKWTGASNYVQKAGEWFGKKLGLGGYGDAEKTAKTQDQLDIKHAEETSGLKFKTADEARAWSKSNGDKLRAAAAAKQSATPQQAAPAPPTPAAEPAPQQAPSAAPAPAAPPSPAPTRSAAPAATIPKPGGTRKVSKNEGFVRVRSELGALGITDPVAQANILGQVGRETGGQTSMKEGDYSKTPFSQFKKAFPGITDPEYARKKLKVEPVTEEEYMRIRKDPKAFFDRVYGWGGMGGYDYRGRGFIQLTGKGNYALYSKLLKQKFGMDVDLVAHPDQLLDPEIDAKVTALYMMNKVPKGASQEKLRDMNYVTRVVTGTTDTGRLAEQTRTAQNYASQFMPGATPEMTPAGPTGGRSGVQMAAATSAAGRTGGASPAPVVVAVNAAQTGSGGGAQMVPLPIAPDNRVIRGVTGAGGSALG